MSMRLTWSPGPSKIGRELTTRVAAFIVGLHTLAVTTAARGESMMKSGAPWNDITGYARGSLYGRAKSTDIELGSTNAEYHLFLELGTVHMAPRPIIRPTVDQLAGQYYRDAMTLARSTFVG